MRQKIDSTNLRYLIIDGFVVIKNTLIFIGIWIASCFVWVSALAVLFKPESNAYSAGAIGILFGPLIIAYLFVRRRNRILRENELSASTLGKNARFEQQDAEKSRLRRRFVERERLIDSIDKHRVALKRNLDRSIVRNDYGVVTGDNSYLALDEFLASIDLDSDAFEHSEAYSLILEQLDHQREQDLQKGFDSSNIPFDGHEFEKWVADSLIGFGWDAETTSGGGDQGIDVIAKRDGLSIGIQCKLYSSAVGNKAIQEAHAGKTYYGLDHAAVLTNAEFTRSAKDLGSVTGVLLLSHHDLPILAAKLQS